NGADFTFTDISGFGVLAIVVSGLSMLVLYLPSLYWLKRRRGGVRPRLDFLLLTGLICNLPLIAAVLILVNRKMVSAKPWDSSRPSSSSAPSSGSASRWSN